MGRPSDKRRSAQRPGKCERARIKKKHRPQAWFYVAGAGRVHMKAGRKKFGRLISMFRRIEEAHHAGDSVTLKSAGATKRPAYTVAPC